jgi:hypothetical protein
VIQKDSVVGVFAQQLFRLLHIFGHVNKVAFEAAGKPLMPAAIVVKKENFDGITLSGMMSEAKLG